MMTTVVKPLCPFDFDGGRPTSRSYAVHLANLEEDMGERTNLKDVEAGLTAELKGDAETWRGEIEARWQREFSPEKQGSVA